MRIRDHIIKSSKFYCRIYGRDDLEERRKPYNAPSNEIILFGSVLKHISDRRRKRHERLRRSNYNFDLIKEEILEILKLVQEVELIMKKNISDMCECLKTLCRKLKKEVSMNHLMDLVQYLGPDSDCLFIKEYSSLEDIPNSIYYGHVYGLNTFPFGDCIIQLSEPVC
ncbi:hypothetical protein Avbf_14344 [Armadillidium vulgare]|nr:hypothetical protein Avbf_14344 [Armadillidium vulgare]